MGEPQSGNAGPGGPAHFEEWLAFRVFRQVLLWLGAVVCVLGAILGFFGYKEFADIRAKAEEVRKTVTNLHKEYAETVAKQRKDSEEAFAAEVTALRAQLSLAERAKDGADAAAASALDSARRSVDQVVESSRKMGELSGKVEGRLEEADRQRGEVTGSLRELSLQSSQLVSGAKQLGDILRAGQKEFEESQTKELTKVRDELKALQALGTTLKEQVFGGTALLIREKSSAPLPGASDDQQQPFAVQTGVFHEDSLDGFAVRDRHQVVLVPPRNLRSGDVITFSTQDYDYKLTNLYILELTFEKDAAGIDLRWMKRVAAKKP